MKFVKINAIFISFAIALTSMSLSTKTKIVALEFDALSDYSKILEEFNSQYGTSYQIATNDQLGSVGIDRQSVVNYYSDMSNDEFYSYICELYSIDIEQNISECSNIYTSAENSEEFSSVSSINISIPDNQMYSGKQKYYYYGSSSEYLYMSSTWGYGDGDYRYNSYVNMGFACTEGTYPYFASYNVAHSITNEARDMNCTYYCSKFIGYGIIDATNWTINVTFHAGRGDIWNYPSV